MEENFENLQELNPNKLFLHLRTENKNGKMQFHYYSEFLNILNTIFLFYSFSSNIQKFSYDILILIVLDSSFLIFSLLFHFITRIKKIHKDNSRISFLLAFISIILSKLFFNENSVITHKIFIFFLFSILFLMSYNYSTKSNHTSSSITKICFIALAFLITFNVDSIILKIRFFLYAIK